jgi:hypothetical protein
MANDQSLASFWYIDTCGVLSTTPLTIKTAMIVYNAAADTAVFVSWDPGKTKKATMTNKTIASIASAKTITSTGNFETAEVAAGDILQFTGTSDGTDQNATVIIDSRDSDNAVTIETGNTLTNRASSFYGSWWTLTPTKCMELLTSGTEKQCLIIPGPISVPNLALQSISTSARVYLYL